MIFDIILIVILASFVLKGFRLGLIEGIGSIIGIILGLLLAEHYYQDLASSLGWAFFGSDTVANIFCFLLIFILVNRLIALIFWIFDKMFKIVAFIPFLKFFNRFFGAALGFIEGVLIIGIVLHLLINFTSGVYWDNKIEESKTASLLQRAGSIVAPLIPKGNDKLQEYIPDVELDKYNIPEYNMPDIEDLL